MNENATWDPTKPNYSVGVSTGQSIGGYPSNFLRWTGDENLVAYQHADAFQTGVVFRQAGATAIALYKAHLASTSTAATATSSQRKIVRDQYGVYHMIYTSVNHVWYCRSGDGTTWEREKQVSEDYELLSLPTNNRFATLTVVPYPNQVVITWERAVQDEYGFACQLVGRTVKNDYSYQMGSIEILADLFSSDAECFTMPAISCMPSGTGFALIVWYDPSEYTPSGRPELRGALYDGGSQSWSSSVTLREATVTSLALAPVTTLSDWTLVWVENNELLYAPVSTTPSLGSPEKITIGGSEVLIGNVSAAHNGFPVKRGVTWEEIAQETDARTVRYTERDAGGWGSIVVWGFGGEGYQKPSVTSNTQADAVGVVWEGDGQLYHARRVSGQWTGINPLTTGTDPSFSSKVSGSVSGTTEIVTSRGLASLYQIQRTIVDLSGLGDSPEDTLVAEGRGGKLLFDKGMMELALLRTSIGGTPIRFAVIADSLRVRRRVDWEGTLVSDHVPPGDSLHVQALYTASGEIPSGVQVRIVLVHGQQVVGTLAILQGTRDSILTMSIPRPAGPFRLGIRTAGLSTVRGFEVHRRFWKDSDGDAPSFAHSVQPSSQLALPVRYALHQNYPNPFNPSTTIRFDVPSDDHVSIVVYDVLGREVARLVDETRSAGYHSAVWGATGVASGVYLVRMSVVGGSGEMAYSAVRKMAVMK